MKIKIYKHSSLKTQIDDDIAKIPQYYNSDFVKQYINEEVTYDIESTSYDYTDDRLFKPNDGQYDVVMVIYETGTFPVYGNASQYSKTLVKCNCSVNSIEDKIDYSWKMFVHELLHAIWYRTMMKYGRWDIPNLLDTYHKNDDPYAVDGNFAKQLEALKPYYNMKKYKYFNEKQDPKMIGVNPKLMKILDTIREECGFPISITSGFRTKEENIKLKGSVEDSAHLLALAVDIACTDSHKRWLLKESAKKNGITRIGTAKTFLHFDIDISKPQYVEWLYD